MTAKKKRFHFSDVMDLQSVSGPLNEGMVSLCNICKSLMDAHVDPNTGMSSNYKEIRKNIEHAEQCMNKTATMTKGKLECLDKCMEQLIKDKCFLEQQKKEKGMVMDNLHIAKKSAEESLMNSKAALEQAEKVVALRKDEIKTETDRMNTGKTAATAGNALLAIPIIGWIAGLVMVFEGQRLSVIASNAIRDAEDELQRNESQVNDNSTKVHNYQSGISTIQNEIKETDEVLKKNQREIEEVKQHLEDTSNIQEMVRKSVNLLSVLSGRVTGLERQTQHFILCEPVIKCLEEVMKAAGNVAENQLLYKQGGPDFINALKKNVEGLLALTNSPKNSEYDSYY